MKSIENIFQCRIVLLLMFITGTAFAAEPGKAGRFDIVEIKRARILKKAAIYLREEPHTVSGNLFGDNTLNLACHYLDGRQGLSLCKIKTCENTTLRDTDNTDNH